MSAVCGRCREEEAVLECADCVGIKRRGDLLPLCDACNALIHVGFLSEHQVVSVTVRQQKKLFEEQLGCFKSQGKNLQLKLNEVNYARQDIEQRTQYNQQVVTQAFQVVWQALKHKEKELTAPLRDTSKKEAALLAECEKNISRVTSDFQKLCTDSQKLLQGNSLDFAQQYDGLKKKLEGFEICGIGTSFPSLGSPARLDVSSLLQNIKDLCLQTDEAPAGDAASKEKVEDEKVSSLGICGKPELQSPKEGDTLQVYVESRLDARGHFWVSRNLSEDIANLYENLSFRIRQDIVQSAPLQVEFEEGMLCCGQFQEDHRWYRGRVEQINKDKGLARVRWLDYAHGNEVLLAAVQPLKEEFQTLPFQALECCLFENLDEDLPHQARWEFSDHTASALLNCTILKQMSSQSSPGNCRAYLVELRNPHKDVDIKEAVMGKAEESSSKKDTMCRDIRYMKDYVPPSGKSTSVKKETTSEKAKDKGDTKEVKKQTNDDKVVEESKGTTGKIEDETKESKDITVKNDKEIDATEKMAEASRAEIVANQGGGDGIDETRKIDVDKMEDAANGGDLEMDSMRSTDQEGGGQKMSKVGEVDDSGQGELAVAEPGAGNTDAVPSSDQQRHTAEDKTLTTLDNASKASPGTVQIMKREETVSGEEKPKDTQGPNGQTDSSTGDIVTSGQQGSAGSRLPGNSSPCPEISSAQSPQSDQNGRPQNAQSDSQRSAAVDAGVYSLEPGDEDDEEGSDHQLIELLAMQGDCAMAHSPDITFGDRSSANSEGMAYRGGGAYYSYGSAGYYMPLGMLGEAQPLEALGLNPIVPSMESSGGGQMETPKSDHSSFTGDGFKIVVGSSFSIYVATRLSDKGRFWASRLRGPAQESQLRRLMHDISLPSEPLTLDKLKEIKVVCAQTESGQWCRAKVEGFLDDKVQVRYVDFGQADVVEELRIKTLAVAYQLFPYQAIELSIATRHQTRFSEQAREAFMRYTQGRVLTAKVVAQDAKTVFVSLSCVDENQLMYDISSAVLNINSETVSSNADERHKERPPTSAENSCRGSRDEQNGGPVSEDCRLSDTQDVRYDHQSEGRSHDRGSGERCFVCSNFGHLSYDCPNKKGDARDRGDRNYKNKGGSNKKNWGRRNRKY